MDVAADILFAAVAASSGARAAARHAMGGGISRSGLRSATPAIETLGIGDWIDRFEMSPARRDSVVIPVPKPVVERLRAGPLWSEVFPPGNELLWPSAASLRALLRFRLQRDAGAIGAGPVHALDDMDDSALRQALQTLRNGDHLPLELDELASLAPARSEPFLSRIVMTNAQGKKSLCSFFDFVKSILAQDNEGAHFNLRTTLGSKVILSKHESPNSGLRFTEHHHIMRHVRESSSLPAYVKREIPNFLNKVENHLGAFDISPYPDLVAKSRPIGWPDAGETQTWVSHARELAKERIGRRIGNDDMTSYMVLHTVASAVEKASEHEIVLKKGPRPKPYRSAGMDRIMANLESSSKVEVTTINRRRRVVHLIETIHDSESAVYDLLNSVRPAASRPQDEGEAKIRDADWLDAATSAWVKVITAPDSPHAVVESHYASAVREVSRFAIQCLWPGEMQWEGGSRTALPRNAAVVRWRDTYLRVHVDDVDVGDNAKTAARNALGDIMLVFKVSDKTGGGADELHGHVTDARPTTRRPAGGLERLVWLGRWYKSAILSVTNAAVDKGANLRTVRAPVRKLVAIALHDLDGDFGAFPLEIEYTNHADTLVWLQTMGGSSRDDLRRASASAGHAVRAFEAGEAETDHRLADVIARNRPMRDRPETADAAQEWARQWVDDALREVRSSDRFAEVCFASGLGEAGFERTMQHLLAVAVQDLGDEVSAVSYPERDRLCPFRDPWRPATRIHPRFADADGRRHPAASFDRVSYSQGAKNDLVRTLMDDQRSPMDKKEAETLAFSIRQHVIELLNRPACAAELAVEHGRPATSSTLHARTITPDELLPYQAGLAGQKGLYVPYVDESSKDWTRRATAQNGRVLGLMMGKLTETDDDGELPGLPPGEDVARSAVALRPGGGWAQVSGTEFCCSTGLANVPLKQDPRNPAQPVAEIDHDLVNARLVQFSIKGTDNTGAAHQTAVLAMIAFDSIFEQSPTANGDVQVWADLGDAYLDMVLAKELGLHAPAQPEASC